MYKIITLFLFPLLCHGQANKEVPLIMFAEGTIEHTAQNQRGSARMYTGNYLYNAGRLLLDKGARVEIAKGGKIVRLEGPGRFIITDLFPQVAEETGFLDRFLDFVRHGLEQSSTTADLEAAYERNQGNAQGNISGYGDAGLAGVLPFGGVLSPGPVTFTWPDRGGAHTLRIADSLSETIVLQVSARDTSFQANLGDLLLEDGKTYYWEVTSSRSPDSGPARLGHRTTSPTPLRIYFRYSLQDPAKFLQDTAVATLSHELSSDVQRQLLKSMVLEEAGYLYAADLAYRHGLTGAPDDELLRRSYASFLARWNQRSRAYAFITQGP